MVLFAFNCIILNICVIELSRSINQSINQFYLLMLLFFPLRTDYWLSVNPLIAWFIHFTSTFFIRFLGAVFITYLAVKFSNSLSLCLLYSFLVNVGGFQFYEGLCGWKNSNQSVSPWKQAVGLDMAAITKQVKSYLQSKGRRSEPGCYKEGHFTPFNFQYILKRAFVL